MSAVFLKQSWSGARAHDENSRTISARLPECLTVRFVKTKLHRRRFLYQRSPTESTEYFLVISTEPNLKLGQQLVEGPIVKTRCLAHDLKFTDFILIRAFGLRYKYLFFQKIITCVLETFTFQLTDTTLYLFVIHDIW